MINKADLYFKRNLNLILDEGCWDENPRPKYKDGTPAHTKFITQVYEEYDISKGEFPITTLRPTAIKTGIKEILWIYQKQTSSLQVAREMGINWWDEWNIGDDTIGLRYGATVKKWDIMNKRLDSVKNNPFSRRHIINLYQESDLAESAGLHPCAFLAEFHVRKVHGNYILDLTLYQRSSDYIMANIINKCQYLALQMMVAGHCGYSVGKFCHFVGNLHIYDRHMPAVEELLKKEPLENNHPYIELNTQKNFYEYSLEDFKIHNTKFVTNIVNKLEIAI